MFYTIYIYISLYIFNLNINNDYITVKTVFVWGMIRKHFKTPSIYYIIVIIVYLLFTKQEFRFRHNTNKLQTLL